MKRISKYHFDKTILFFIFLFFIISIITIYCAEQILPENNYYYIKQCIWYGIGFIFILLIMKYGNDTLYKYAWPLYILSNISLLLLLLFARPINEAKCWFTIQGIGTVQPSEFTKIILIIIISKLIKDYQEQYKNPTVKEEFLFLLKIILVLIPPSLLTFLEPDTGVVLIYFLITAIMLFIAGIRYRWFLLVIFFLLAVIIFVVGLYFVNETLFVKIFGSSFFLRIHRLLDWSNKSGYQLENSLISIGSAGLFGHGFKQTPLYFPEPQTDFIFAVFSSCFGLIGSFLLIILIACFDIKLIYVSKKAKRKEDQYVIAGIVGMLIYQQIQNIGMTFGLLPITGITLPFISYGGSSLISYMIMLGLIFNTCNTNLMIKNKSRN